MNRTDKLIVEYLNASFGENPTFNTSVSRILNPYTFNTDKRTRFELNGQFFCHVTDGRPGISFCSALLKTINSLFDTNQFDSNRILEDWFHEKTPKVNY
jgi:hypothetical protein